jgi:branched-chain amino acid transport system ATP-binding protein
VTSLSEVSLRQQRGEILAVIGPNGAGKTSLFNCLTGVYTPEHGTIVFHGADGRSSSAVGRKPHRVNALGIARTFQTSRLFNALTAFENVKIGVESRQHTGPLGAMLRLPRTRREERQSDERALELLEFVGLRQRANELASALPYGGRRRLEIARALGTAPQLLLLDEPAAGTNPSEKVELAQLIRRVNDEMHVTVLLIEHDMRLVMSLVDRVVVLNFGKVIATGTPAEVQGDPAVIEAYLGAPSEAEPTLTGPTLTGPALTGPGATPGAPRPTGGAQDPPAGGGPASEDRAGT